MKIYTKTHQYYWKLIFMLSSKAGLRNETRHFRMIAGFINPAYGLIRNTQTVVQAFDHSQAQRTFAVKHFRYPAAAADITQI
jgi:hypothetical protein